MNKLQNTLNLRVQQKQILTPGLVQMVTVLALNKIELKDMITAEMVENPVLDELETSIPSIEEIAGREEKRDRESSARDVTAEETPMPAQTEAADGGNDPFEQVDFGSFFRDYLDPGHRTHMAMEEMEKPSFENFLSKPTTLTDHLAWQLGSLSMTSEVREACNRIIGNLNEEGYLIASDDELRGMVVAEPEPVADTPEAVSEAPSELPGIEADALPEPEADLIGAVSDVPTEPAKKAPPPIRRSAMPPLTPISKRALQEALQFIHAMDPIGVGSRTLRECLLLQLRYLYTLSHDRPGNGHSHSEQVWQDAIAMVDSHLKALQGKQYREIARALGQSQEAVMEAYELIKTLDPRPGLRYNREEPRLIEPDVAFVKHGDEWLVVMNDDDLPQLRLNPGYKRLMQRDAAEKDVRNYVKERYRSAIQLIKNIEQRKQTILKVCYSIIARQREFLEHGVDFMAPMMIKEVAEEIGVHPSTVSRAVSSKYVHTPQGVFELRYFFSESVQGPEGGGTSLLALKRRVKKIIEEEDPRKPLTDDHITRMLQSQGIQVTRRTVAKYREDMRIPSTHQRRVKD